MRFCLFALMGILTAPAGYAQTAQDTHTVKRVILLFQDDFNDGRFKQASTYTTRDWVHINPLGGVDRGRDSVLSIVRSVHQTFLKGVTMTTEGMTLRFIPPNVAIADVVHKITDYTTPDGVRHQNERHIKTYVVVKKNGKWLLTHDHNTIVQNPPPK